MLMLACIPLVVAILSRLVWHGRTQEMVVDLILLTGFFASLIVAFTTAIVLFKFLAITTLIGLFIKWIRDFGTLLIAGLCAILIGLAWL